MIEDFLLSLKRGRRAKPYFHAQVAPHAPHVWFSETWREPDSEPGCHVGIILTDKEARQLRDWLTKALYELSPSRTKQRSKRNRTEYRIAQLAKLTAASG